MRLGFVTGRWISEDGGLWTDAGLGRLMDALQGGVDRFTAAGSLIRERHPLHDHRLALARSDLVPLPEMLSFRAGVFRQSECRAAIREVERRSDVVIVQLPFTAPLALGGALRPRVYHVCADVYAIVNAAEHYEGVLRLASVAVAQGVHQLYRVLTTRPDARVVTNGRSLLERYHPAKGRAVVSSALRERDMSSVERSRSDGGFRVLFVGHLRPEKGIDILLTAFEELLASVPGAELHIIGPENAPQLDVAQRLEARVERLRASGRVELCGHRGFGPELFQCFADADVLALPSLSEGTPRVLIEARAFGCPVVASNVGGIPTSVEDGVDGLLVPPGDPRALAAALRRLALDLGLRGALVERGRDRARAHTVEAFARSILEETEVLVRPRCP
jgi:glycosyltransferase involved in cell wall biosynthesis